MWDPLSVRVGQPITARLWDGLVARVRAARLLEGPGIRLQHTPDGTIISAKGSDAGRYVHPFQVSIAGDRLMIRAGLVNGIEPRIKGIPLSGDAKNPQPSLDFKRPKLDQDGRGYAALELGCGADWQIPNLGAEIVQVAAWDTETGEPGIPTESRGAAGIPGLSGRRVRYPIALLRRNKAGAIDVFQIVHFNVSHSAKPRDTKSDIARHFFAMGGVA